MMINEFILKLEKCAIDHDCEAGKNHCCSRYDCRLLMKCEECGWQGELRNAVHGYHDDGTLEDVEACDECPECGSENLIEVENDNTTTLSS